MSTCSKKRESSRVRSEMNHEVLKSIFGFIFSTANAGTLNKVDPRAGPVCLLRKSPLTSEEASGIDFVMLAPGKR